MNKDKFIKLCRYFPFIGLGIAGLTIFGGIKFREYKINEENQKIKSYITEADEIDVDEVIEEINTNEPVEEEVSDSNINEEIDAEEVSTELIKVVEYRSTELLDMGYIFDIIDYEGLYELNNDFAAWIKIPDTKVNYPVVQQEYYDDFYLHNNYEGNYSVNGTLYADDREKYVRTMTEYTEGKTNMYVIYGHNMASGEMFNNLAGYKNQSYYETHNYGVFYTEDKVFMLEPVAAFVFSGESEEPLYIDGFTDKEKFKEYKEFLKVNSLIECSALEDLNFGETLVTGVTCDYTFNNARLAVVFRVKEQAKSYDDIMYDETIYEVTRR